MNINSSYLKNNLLNYLKIEQLIRLAQIDPTIEKKINNKFKGYKLLNHYLKPELEKRLHNIFLEERHIKKEYFLEEYDIVRNLIKKNIWSFYEYRIYSIQDNWNRWKILFRKTPTEIGKILMTDLSNIMFIKPTPTVEFMDSQEIGVILLNLLTDSSLFPDIINKTVLNLLKEHDIEWTYQKNKNKRQKIT